ncbi:hypothetical protein BC936DRAFT_141475 [Jimgerdemannia flammicorona]|uniref:Uncharacterized protein n=1 Tax=Jimgerdemannia flammicorona TaxID=994334 RepID=A0A433A265_9FUNG|nr:hypothetical protein BC936DRAFT_141475 [Jimgerdemannia flammicorona]
MRNEIERTLLRLLRQKRSMDVGQNTTLGNSNIAQQLVKFLIVADGKLKVTGDDTRLLVIASGITSQL